ncbi:MAG: replication initiation protein [Bacteroidota bacterium]
MKIEEGKKGSVSNIEFELPTPILEAVKNPEMYVKLDLFILRGLRSKYSSALYEALKDYQNLNSIRVEIEVLRKLMGVKEGQYVVFTMFKKRVLDRAVEEINEKTDVTIQYKLERIGRKVVAVIFSVS